MRFFTPRNICVALMLVLATTVMTAKQFTVVLDAGHGGKDIGARGTITNEKTINLAVAKALGKKIESSSDDIKVVYTRDTDVFIPLNERAQIANKAKGDLFISIHVNSLDRKNKNFRTISGAEVYTLGLHKTESNLAVARRENSVMTLEEDYSETYKGFDPNSVESYIAFELSQSKHLDLSIAFAAEAENQLISYAGRANKGVKQAGFWVLHATSMPAVLIELDFICNPKSEKFMASTEGQEKLAEAIFRAFSKYHKSVTNTATDTPTTSQPNAPETADAQPSKQSKPKSPIRRGGNKKGDGSPSTDQPKDELSDRQPINGAFDGDPQAKPEVKESAPSGNDIDYRIQITMNMNLLPADAPEFKGAEEVEYYKDQDYYKYTIGHFDNMDDARARLKEARAKFPDAFIVKIRDGKRIK